MQVPVSLHEIAYIDLPKPPNIHLHENLGFVEVSHFRKTG